jgi:DNA-binding NarL/FixJ family response regulator
MIYNRKPTVLIADDHAMLAEGIARLLSADYQVLGMVANGRQLVSDAARLNPDLVVLDISMPELNGIDAARQLHRVCPRSKVVFVTQQANTQYLRAALHAGARGYVVKQSASDELLSALRRVVAGGVYVSPMLEERVGYAPTSELAHNGTESRHDLTGRQREVLQLVAEGKTSREIGTALGISAKTVEFHKRGLMDQTGLRTTAELTRFAVSRGLVAL